MRSNKLRLSLPARGSSRIGRLCWGSDTEGAASGRGARIPDRAGASTRLEIPRGCRHIPAFEPEFSMSQGLIPATILTGFLGSGKTTLLKRVLSEAHGQKIAVIENEFGEENIDNEILVTETKEQIIQMNNGCICCTIREDLRATLPTLAAQEAQGRARFRPRGDRDHRPGRPGPGGADLLHGRRDRRELPARLDPDAGRRQARRPAARRPPGGAPPGGLCRPDLHQQDRPGRRRHESKR